MYSKHVYLYMHMHMYILDIILLQVAGGSEASEATGGSLEPPMGP